MLGYADVTSDLVIGVKIGYHYDHSLVKECKESYRVRADFVLEIRPNSVRLFGVS